MITRPRWALALALIFGGGAAARAADQADVARGATKLLEEISRDPDSGIPPQFLHEAKAIMIVPHMVETQLGVGLRKGHGVFLARDGKGEWGQPEPVALSKISAGPEAGREVTDLVVIYRTQKAVDRDSGRSLSLGLSFRVAGSLKPRHKFDGPKFDGKVEKEVLTYTRKSGILVGVRIIGGRMSVTPSAPPPSKTPSEADQPPADGGARVASGTTKGDPPAPAAEAPEAGRLREVLTAMTSPPAPQVAGPGKTDPKLSPAVAAKPPAGTAASPR